ncbi:DUF4397 domain-containing protein [Rhodocytophaga rosea]|nr:DUF4397 domain-containing protein [Rhodocytophaga rosea]
MKKPKFLNWRTMFFLLIAPMVSFTACNDDDTDATPERAKVLVVHASPSAPGVDLLVDNTKVNTAALTFPNNTGYLDVNAGARNFKVNVTGTSTTAIEATPTLVANKNYSVFAINAEANNSGTTFEPLLLEDNLTTPASGQAHVRFIHLSPDAPAVDIVNVTGGANTILIPNRAYKSATDFIPLPAGTYDLAVRVAGTQTTALSLPGVTLEAGKILTVFARGFLNPPAGNTNTLGAQIIDNTAAAGQ